MALLQGKAGKSLGFGDYLTTGVKSLFIWNFSLPVIGLGLIVGVIVQQTIGGTIDSLSGGGAGQAGALASSLGIAFISSLFVALYGQVFAVMASASKAVPTVGAAVARVGDRWVSILGAGLLGALCTVGILVAGLIVVGAGAGVLGSGPGAGLLILFVFVYMYLQLRLGQAAWFAADGMSAVDSLKASWTKTQGHLWRIFGWSLGGGFVFGIINFVLGMIASALPAAVAMGATTGIGLCLTYGSGIVLYRKITSK